MPGKVHEYGDGSSIEIHPDGGFTVNDGKGNSYTFDKEGNATVKKKGHKPKVIKGEEKKKGRKWVFIIDGKRWTVTIRDNEVEIEKTTKEVPHVPEGAEKWDKKSGEKSEKGPLDKDWKEPKTKPKSSSDVPDDPEYDNAEKPSGGGGGGNKPKEKPKKKPKKKAGKKRGSPKSRR